MKIAVADNQSLKFDQDLVDYWKQKHEVKYEIGASEFLFEWCDVYYINYWDHNIHYLYEWHQKHPKAKKPKIICRAIDWEVWIGFARSEEMARWVDEIIAIAPHIKRKLEAENLAMKDRVKLIRPGVNLEQFDFKPDRMGHNIVLPCNEIDWWMKGVISGLRIFKQLVDTSSEPWKLFIKGKWTKPDYERLIITDYIEKTGISDRVVIDDTHAPNYNAYLDDMDYCLVPSLKEAFSFVTAQCAAKGIRPVLNWWYGAEEIWDKSWIYSTESEAVDMLLHPPNPVDCYQYVSEHYDVKRMFKEFDALL